MAKKTKWSIDVCSAYLNAFFKENNFPSFLGVESSFLKKVCDDLNIIYPGNDYTPDTLMSNVTNLHLDGGLKSMSPHIKGSSKDRINNFHRSKTKTIGVNVEDLKKDLIETLIKLQDSYDALGLERIDVNFNENFSVFENINQIAKANNINELEACAELYRQGFITIYKNNIIKKEKLVKKDIKDFNLNNEDLRKEIGKAFDHLSADYNLFLFNDGTGSGKTHNVVMNYATSFNTPVKNEKELLSDFISEYSNVPNVFKHSKRHSFIFIAPQKNQLFTDYDVYVEASKNQIPLLFARSIADLLNLQGKNFFYANKDAEEYNTVQEFLDIALRSGKGMKKHKLEVDKTIKKLCEKRREIIVQHSKKKENSTTDVEDDKKITIPSISATRSAYIRYRDFETNYGYEKENNKDWFKTNYDLAKEEFRKNLTDLAMNLSQVISDETLQKVFTSGSFYNGFNNFETIFGENASLYELAYNLISFVLPFEVAKYINVIIYMTGDKSQTHMPVSEPHSKVPDVKVCRNYDLDEMVSGYKISRKADLLSVYRETDKFAKFLNNEYFKKNYYNFFIRNDLGFSIVGDEEHVLYNKFVEDYTFKNITERKGNVHVNISHSLSAIARWIKNVNSGERNITNFQEIFWEKSQIISNLFKCIKENTSLKTDDQIKGFFNSVFCNENGIFVKTSDYQFISSVCDNVTSFSPKLIILEEYLKLIKVITKEGKDNILVSKSNEQYDEDSLKYTMLDFFQVVLALLFVCKDASKNLKSLLFREKDKNNQNNALYHLILLATDNKDFLHNLFNSSLELTEDDPVNFQFAYFLTKIGFNFEFPKKIASREYSDDSIPVNPNIFIIRELPEVGVLHSLKNSKNKMFLLSATRGFNNIFAGNYSEYFFDEINKYCPGVIKVFKRENQKENKMPIFIEERFDKRTSIEIIKLDIKNNVSKKGNAVDMVNALIYPVKNISLNSLHHTDDISPVRENYALINPGEKNYLEDLVFKAKNSAKLRSLSNPFNRAEILGILNSMVHSFEKGENSIVMTLSNRFKEFMANPYFMNEVFGADVSGENSIVSYLRSDENRYKVFEYKPIVGSNRKLRVIFFDAELGRVVNLKEHMILDPDTTIVLVSSYNSAGTGLNLTLSGGTVNEEDKAAVNLLKDTTRDFSSIYFVSSPYYTSVKGDKGYGHLSNQIIIYKHFAHTGSKKLKDLADGLNSRKIKAILYREHLMEKVKSLMQSAGRIERRDFPVKTRIYFVENGLTPLFEQAMSEFYEMFKSHSNQYAKTIISNFSMINKSFVKVAQNHVSANCLTIAQRNSLESETKLHHEVFLDFFSNVQKFPMMLNQYRLDNQDFSWVAEFNSILRNYTLPNYNIQKFLVDFIKKNQTKLKISGSYSYVVDLLPVLDFDLDAYDIPKDKQLTIDWDKGCYSDYSNASLFLDDGYFFDYARGIGLNEVDKSDQFLSGLFQNYRYTQNANGLTRLPNLYLSHIIRGNVGEKVLVDYLNSKNVPFNDIGVRFNPVLDKFLYELFDFYIVKGNKFFAIDTKNWSQYNDSGARKVLENLPEKMEKIKSRPELKDYDINFIYLNMFPEFNDSFTQGLSTHLGSFNDVKYMYFMSKYPLYLPDEESQEDKYKGFYELKNEVYMIDDQWRKTI